MIIFYQKSTGNIVGTVEGRVHSPEEIEKMWIQPSNIDKSDIGKYVVPYEPRYENGKVVELVATGPMAKIVSDYEKGKGSILAEKFKSK